MTTTSALQPAPRCVVKLPSLRRRWVRRALVVFILTATFSAAESLRELLLPAWSGLPALLANATVGALFFASLIFCLRNVGVFLSTAEVTALLGAERDLITLQRQLLAAARTDKLTGLPNRTVLLEKLQSAIDLHRASPHSHYALLFLDFDRFKLVNDTLGHLAGDELLCEIALRLESALRPSDVVAPPPEEATTTRLGGDEFVILITGLRSTADASRIADRLLATLREPYTIASRRIRSTASIGIVTSDIGHHNAADLLRDADTAMYEAKAAGKGTAALFTPSMRSRVQQKSQLEIAAN